jgi:hypothetical protein
MSRILPLNDKEEVKRAVIELGLFNPQTEPGWLSTLYMPITRDLSTGKRKLLAEWAQAVRRGIAYDDEDGDELEEENPGAGD